MNEETKLNYNGPVPTNPDIIHFTTKMVTHSDLEKVVIVNLEVFEAGADDAAEYFPTLEATGTAICHPDDEFSYSVGQMLAFARAQKKAAKALARGAIELWENGQALQKSAYRRVDADG